jgi:hypothetical protein
MTTHKIGTHEEWQAQRDQLVKDEKELTRRGDELASKRRELPWVPVEKEHRFETEDGNKALAVHPSRTQLLVYTSCSVRTTRQAARCVPRSQSWRGRSHSSTRHHCCSPPLRDSSPTGAHGGHRLGFLRGHRLQRPRHRTPMRSSDRSSGWRSRHGRNKTRMGPTMAGRLRGAGSELRVGGPTVYRTT